MLVVGDIHTAGHGALVALAFGIGTSEVEHVLATQTLLLTQSKTMEVRVGGTLGFGVTPKDVVLAIIGKIGAAGGTGYVIEYTGRSEEHTSELQSLMRIAYAVFCLKKKNSTLTTNHRH